MLSKGLVALWLVLSASLSEATTSVEYSGLACEGSYLTMTCAEGYLIKVKEAFFGRNDTTTCVDVARDSTTMCSSDTPLDVLKTRCDGKRTCDATANTGLFGDRCWPSDTAKYLRAVYTCEQRVYKGLVCEGAGKVPLACPGGHLIETQKAYFGRKDATTCPHKTMGLTPSTPCNATQATEVFKQMCDGKQDCEIGARVETFGDPCPNVYKYLELDYTCTKCTNDYGSDAQCEYWANMGYCSSNPLWMVPNCRKACWQCSNEKPKCEDVHTNQTECATWSEAGECERNPSWMIPFCRKSCMKCDQEVVEFQCTNSHPNMTECETWANQANQCVENSVWMMNNCKKSCLKCEKKTPDCLNAHKNQGECEWWAKQGQCTKNPYWMHLNCWQSCTKCGGAPACVNLHFSDDDCKKWADKGDCETSNTTMWMMTNCRKACLNCTSKALVCTNQHSKEEDCNWWAGEGYCDTNAVWMHKNCWKSCTQCGKTTACENVHDDAECDWWAYHGECARNPSYMMLNCRMSCTRCKASQGKADCVNSVGEADCDYWASNGECAKNPGWMLPYCRKSCTFCDFTGPLTEVTDKVYMNVSIGGQYQGRIVFGLFRNAAPKTVENFKTIAEGTYTDPNGWTLSYKDSIFHRIIKEFVLQGGDIVFGTGYGWASIYGGNFIDENFRLKHYGTGWVNMANAGPNTNACQFAIFVTPGTADWLDRKHIVFARILEGMDVARKMEQVSTNTDDRPNQDVKVDQCGSIPVESGRPLLLTTEPIRDQ